jgi:hypothetical protein
VVLRQHGNEMFGGRGTKQRGDHTCLDTLAAHIFPRLGVTRLQQRALLSTHCMNLFTSIKEAAPPWVWCVTQTRVRTRQVAGPIIIIMLPNQAIASTPSAGPMCDGG